MEGSIRDLSEYRLKTAKEDLARAKAAFDADDYKLSLNRSYYSIFHALRAVNSLDGFDSSKHTGVIAHFNQEHVKNNDFPKSVSKMVSSAMDFRQKSDYEDFYTVSKSDADEQIRNAEVIVNLVDGYIKASKSSGT